MIGAASISAFPIFSGFISKSMIVSAAAHNKLTVVWLILQFASAGVFHHAGIKVPYFTFFGHDSGIRAKEPPLNMQIAMGIAAFLCVFIGIFPQPLYSILPYPVDYVPYTAAHVVGQLQLLMFGALAFTLLILSGYYPPELRAINLDTDWFYRKGSKLILSFVTGICDRIASGLEYVCIRVLPSRLAAGSRKPITHVVDLYLKAVGKSPAAVENPEEGGRYETTSLMPVGIPVLLAVLFIMVLTVVFFSTFFDA
jgi:multicomponent Na+:H+ antiporter subunit D